ncbi:ubiquinol-cytochrome c reductase core subunit 1 [Massospora cicadina]|nr:ubiquinol-cytochrome c reductase core subunit 1 [Massospora cicadina]
MFRAIRSTKIMGNPQRSGYASVASSASSAIKVTKLQNGIKVVTQGNSAPTATLCAIAQAGTRFETKLGISHYLKNFAFKNTTNKTGFRLIREAELQGASLSAILTRESIIYMAQFFREDEIIFDSLRNSKYTDHQAEDVMKIVRREISLASIETHVINGLHLEAFRTGLGNSTLGLPQEDIFTNDIREYASQAFAPSRLTFYGFNVDASSFNVLKDSFVNSTSSLKTEASKYFGGEIRQSAMTPVSHLAIGFEGASLGSEKEAILTVLRHILGGQSHLKWGNGVSPFAKLANGTNIQATAFNFSYSDAGLFGLYIVAPPSHITQLANSSLAEIRKITNGISAEELKRGIALAKFESVSSIESQFSKALFFGNQVNQCFDKF